MTDALLKKIADDLDFLKKKVTKIEEEINYLQPPVKKSYKYKLKKISEEEPMAFDNKEDFLNYIENEI